MGKDILNSTTNLVMSDKKERIKEVRKALRVYKEKNFKLTPYEKMLKLKKIMVIYFDVIDEILVENDIQLDKEEILLLKQNKNEFEKMISNVKEILNRINTFQSMDGIKVVDEIRTVCRLNNYVDVLYAGVLSGDFTQDPTIIYKILLLFSTHLCASTILILLNKLCDFKRNDYIEEIEKLVYSNIISGNNNEALVEVWKGFPNRQTNLNLNDSFLVYEEEAKLFGLGIGSYIKYTSMLSALPDTVPYSVGDSKQNRITEYSEKIIHFGCDSKRLEQMIIELIYMCISPIDLFEIVYLSKISISNKCLSRIIEYIIKVRDNFSIYMFAKYIKNIPIDSLVRYALNTDSKFLIYCFFKDIPNTGITCEDLIAKGIDEEYMESTLNLMEDTEFIKLHQQLTNIDFLLIHSVSMNMIDQYSEASKCHHCIFKMNERYELRAGSKLYESKIRHSGPILSKKPNSPKNISNKQD